MPSRKWKLEAAAMALLIASITACDSPGDPFWGCTDENCRTIEASKVQSFPGIRDTVIGASFTVNQSATNAIKSDGTGGACLVADLRAIGYPKMKIAGRCSSNSQCQGGLPPSWFGYCDRHGDGACWVRPGDQNDKHLCNKSTPLFQNPVKPWVDGKDNPVTLDEYRLSWLAPYAAGKRIRFRAVACLNGLSHGCAEVDSKDRIEVFGEPSAPFTIPLSGVSRPGELGTGGSPPAPTPDKGRGGGASVNPQ